MYDQPNSQTGPSGDFLLFVPSMLKKCHTPLSSNMHFISGYSVRIRRGQNVCLGLELGLDFRGNGSGVSLQLLAY